MALEGSIPFIQSVKERSCSQLLFSIPNEGLKLERSLHILSMG
jgi:hypothetical protein